MGSYKKMIHVHLRDGETAMDCEVYIERGKTHDNGRDVPDSHDPDEITLIYDEGDNDVTKKVLKVLDHDEILNKDNHEVTWGQFMEMFM